MPSPPISNSITSPHCAAFIEKSELTTGGSLPRPLFPSFQTPIVAFASRKILLPPLAVRNPDFSIESAGIAVDLGEGTDRKKAVATCQKLYELLQSDYGPLTIPEDKSPRGAQAAPPGVQAIAATMNADLFGVTHIVPVKQPKDMQVFGIVRSAMIKGRSGTMSPSTSINAPNQTLQPTPSRRMKRLRMNYEK